MPGTPAPAPMDATGLTARLGRPRSQGLILIVCLIALVAAAKAVLIDNLDIDCFWHLRVAEQLKSDGVGPLVDRLSFASTQAPWTPYSWLAELAMKAVWDWGGYRAAVLGNASMQAAFVLAVAACCRTARAADGARARFLPPAGALDDFDRRPAADVRCPGDRLRHLRFRALPEFPPRDGRSVALGGLLLAADPRPPARASSRGPFGSSPP